MFKVGDKIKMVVSVVEKELAQWKGSQVYDNLVKAAQEKRFEVVGEDTTNYAIKRLEDGQVMHETKSATHVNFEKTND